MQTSEITGLSSRHAIPPDFFVYMRLALKTLAAPGLALLSMLGFEQGAEAAKPQSGGASNASPARTSPNFLIIVVDDQGYADLSAYEHSAPDVSTPNMDRLAKRGILFTNAYATAGVCSAARAGWKTGRHQARWDPTSGFNCGLPKGTPTLASMLKAHGYATAKIGKNDYSNRSLHKHNVGTLRYEQGSLGVERSVQATSGDCAATGGGLAGMGGARQRQGPRTDVRATLIQSANPGLNKVRHGTEVA